jgi:hypothetical protein
VLGQYFRWVPQKKFRLQLGLVMKSSMVSLGIAPDAKESEAGD